MVKDFTDLLDGHTKTLVDKKKQLLIDLSRNEGWELLCFALERLEKASYEQAATLPAGEAREQARSFVLFSRLIRNLPQQIGNDAESGEASSVEVEPNIEQEYDSWRNKR